MSDILLGKGERPVHLLAKYGNRHGLVSGATGTGKTVSLLVMAEGFSRMGVPVFIADVKGDVAGIAMPGTASDAVLERARVAAAPARRTDHGGDRREADDPHRHQPGHAPEPARRARWHPRRTPAARPAIRRQPRNFAGR